ncbi:MAG TPA: AIPR family protein [Baekduia sp.]
MDRITQSLLDDFVTSEGLESLSPSDAFERFATYCVVSREHPETFNVEDLMIGSGNDTGIDSIATLVNGSLVSSADEIDDLAQTNGYVEASFVFVQAKTTGGFDVGSIGTFCTGVRDFFSVDPVLPRNDSVAAAAELQAEIYTRSARFRRGNPHCRLYYVTTGRWQEDANLRGRAETEIQALRDLGIFEAEEVELIPVDAGRLQALYRETQHRVTSEFQFPDRTVLPEMDGVTEAHLGVLPASEYLKLITDDAEQLRRSLFYDNVRDFQDFNVVNEQMRRTLESAGRGAFALLNNGVTIVTRRLNTTGNKFVMEDYQVVNGCQTSHVLYREREHLTPDVHVPLKIIATVDDELTNAVIRATNSQTPIGPEDLQALSDFQKKLEAYFDTFDGRHKLFYERRSKQYDGVPGVEKVRVITRAQQIRAFASMFLDEPHRAGRYFSTLLKEIGNRIFADTHPLEAYYASAYAQYRLEFMLRNGQLESRYRPARHHILMAVRHGVLGDDVPSFQSNEFKRQCSALIDMLHDDAACANAFLVATNVIDQVVEDGRLDRDTVRTQTFADAVSTEAARVARMDPNPFHGMNAFIGRPT